MLTDQVEAQGEKIRDLESALEEHHQKLVSTEEMLQQVGHTHKDTQTLTHTYTNTHTHAHTHAHLSICTLTFILGRMKFNNMKSTEKRWC